MKTRNWKSTAIRNKFSIQTSWTPTEHFLRVQALIKKNIYVGNLDFSFITENLTILKYFLLKVTMLKKMQNFKFTFRSQKHTLPLEIS